MGPTVFASSQLVHADGIDFRVLEPTWFAVGLFVGLSLAATAATVSLVERWTRPDAWALRSP